MWISVTGTVHCPIPSEQTLHSDTPHGETEKARPCGWLTGPFVGQWNTLVERSLWTTDNIWSQVRFQPKVINGGCQRPHFELVFLGAMGLQLESLPLKSGHCPRKLLELKCPHPFGEQLYLLDCPWAPFPIDRQFWVSLRVLFVSVLVCALNHHSRALGILQVLSVGCVVISSKSVIIKFLESRVISINVVSSLVLFWAILVRIKFTSSLLLVWFGCGVLLWQFNNIFQCLLMSLEVEYF